MKWLKYDDWINAINLIDYEVSLKNKNKHFNTLDIFYYDELSSSFKNEIKKENFFDDYIKTNFVLGLDDLLFNYKYCLPKNDYSFRNHSFLSYMARIIHTSIGLYLYRLTDDFIKKYYNNKNSKVYSFYGGIININENGIILKDDNVYYRKSYKGFLDLLTNKINLDSKVDSHYVIKIDIKDYFDSIKLDIFLNELLNKLSYKTKSTYNYNYDTIDNITSFYKIIMKSSVGYPQCNNDVTGGFVTSLFMKLIDLEIFESINEFDEISECNIYQYCDDTYLDLKYDNIVDCNRVIQLLSNISKRINEKFGLQLNSKTQICEISCDEDIIRFRENIKYNSMTEFIVEHEDPKDILKKILDNYNDINNMNNDNVNNNFILGYIFDNKVEKLLNSKKFISKVEDTILKIDLNKFIVYSKYLIPLCIKSEVINNYIKKYIDDYDDYKIPFYFEYIFKIDKNYYKNISKNIKDKSYAKVLNYSDYCNPKITYLSIKKNNIKKMSKDLKNDLINQIVLRRVSESMGNYGYALNHLINEVQVFIYYTSNQTMDISDFNANKISEIICSMNPNSIIKIMNAFNRRNNNMISHSTGSVISCEEYYKIKKEVSDFMKIYLKDVF